jgi:hypothetical protein
MPVAAGNKDVGDSCAIDAPTALALKGRAGTSLVCLAADDRTLERMWRARFRLGARLQGAGIKLVIAPAFSLWWPDPPFEGLHEMARTAALAALLAPHVDTIPAVAWRTPTDIARWTDWLAASPPGAVAVDLSTLRRHDYQWQWAMDGVESLADRLSRVGIRPRLVAVGPFAPRKLRDIRIAWPHPLTIASRAVWQLARAGMLIELRGQRSQSSDLDFEDLLASNVATMELQLAEDVMANVAEGALASAP